MPTADQIKALIRSHVDQDEERFYAIALQMAAHAARQGHGRVATDLREMVDRGRKQRRPKRERPIAVVTPRGELSGLLAVSLPKARLSDMVLDDDVERPLIRVLQEQRASDKLYGHGLVPARKLLLVGPPGTGKTMTASVLAGELNLPLYVVVLHALITRFMGETAAKLHLVFDAMAQNRGVYLFDEFDAIGAQRSVGQDLGEIRRVLNSFLQFLEQDGSRSIVVAATNHPQGLDDALFRRFDSVVQYRNPSPALACDLARNRLAVFDTERVDWETVAIAADGLSYAEVAASADAAAKEAVMRDTIVVTTEGLTSAMRERRRPTTTGR